LRVRVPRISPFSQSLSLQFLKNIYHLIHQLSLVHEAPGLVSTDRIFGTQVNWSNLRFANQTHQAQRCSKHSHALELVALAKFIAKPMTAANDFVRKH
jgi:hypothetical protein